MEKSLTGRGAKEKGRKGVIGDDEYQHCGTG
jgi:hypothetical protein